jgi:tetratricopeptide (TPR) repeat protein
MTDRHRETDHSIACRHGAARLLRRGSAVAVLLLALLAAYHNSFTASWHFDDFPNIVENINVHMSALTWESIRQSMLGIEQRGMNRPLAYVSFALNHYFGGLEVFGYHLVNFVVHCLTALLLYGFVRRTLELPFLKDRYGLHSSEIACLAALFWACNPVQVSSVTYIVQRMASLGALFYIASLYGYLRGRTVQEGRNRAAFYSLALISALLALGTKENTLTLPAAVLLYDVLFIQGVRRETIRRSALIALIPLGLALFYAALRVSPSSLFEGYALRPFTLTERLLTEPRVILFYLSLLFFPLSSRLTLLHDFDLSRSLWEPWTTFPSILVVSLLLGAGIFIAKKRPLLSFALLFFLLNHVIEGSFIPLEIVYVHRNYLPSMFLFVVPAAWLVRKVVEAPASRYGRVLAAGSIAGILLFGVANTILQNRLYEDEMSLWSDNIRKAPNLYRPYQNLSRALTKEGRYDEALEAMRRALEAPGVSFTFQKFVTYNDLGDLFAFRGNLTEAEGNYLRAVELAPFYAKPYFGLTKVLLRENKPDEALAYARRALDRDAGNAEFHLFHSIALIRTGRLAEAGRSAAQALSIRNEYMPAWLILAELERRKGHPERAQKLCEAVMAQTTRDVSCEMIRTLYRYLYDDRGEQNCSVRHERLLAYYRGETSTP